MSKHLARTLSCTFAPALVALVGLTAGSAWALDPADIPAKAADVPVEHPHTKGGEGKGFHHKHHAKKHHAKKHADGAAKHDGTTKP